jgi:putative exosortase-associated protein (TIGR04073 family)
MRIIAQISLVGLAALFAAGCAGPEKKLGRGVLNVTEFARMGELRRSVEQTALYENTYTAYTTGVIRGFNRSLVRTVMGACEIATFPIPIPTYDAWFTPKSPLYPDPTIKNKSYPFGGMVLTENPVYPASYAPGLIEDSTFFTDTALGFSGGDIAPFVPGSRFKIFDN